MHKARIWFHFAMKEVGTWIFSHFSALLPKAVHRRVCVSFGPASEKIPQIQEGKKKEETKRGNNGNKFNTTIENQEGAQVNDPPSILLG